MLKQQFTIAPPLIIDSQTLKDYTSVIQRNLQQLFIAGHVHNIQTTAPAATDGNTGDTLFVALGTSPYLYIKFPDPIGWKRVLLS